MWKLYAVLSAVFAAATAILAKVGVKGINTNIAMAIRTVIILFMAWGIVLATGQIKSVRELSRTNIFFLVLSGIATGLSWLFYFKALETGPISKVAPLDKLSVAITIGLSFLILKEPVDLKVIAGGLLIVAGTFVLLQ
ncbi:MAG: EamA family transporter [Chitinophagaceae bacterium]